MYVFAHLLFFSDAVPCADSRENHSFPIAPIEPAWSRRGALRSASPLRSPVFQPSPRTGNSGFALPVAEEAKPEFPQRSKIPSISASPTGFSGTARWTGGAKRRMRSPRSGILIPTVGAGHNMTAARADALGGTCGIRENKKTREANSLPHVFSYFPYSIRIRNTGFSPSPWR